MVRRRAAGLAVVRFMTFGFAVVAVGAAAFGIVMWWSSWCTVSTFTSTGSTARRIESANSVCSSTNRRRKLSPASTRSCTLGMPAIRAGRSGRYSAIRPAMRAVVRTIGASIRCIISNQRSCQSGVWRV